MPHRLEHHRAAGLAIAREHEDVSGAVEGVHLGAGLPAVERDVAEPVLLGQPSAGRQVEPIAHHVGDHRQVRQQRHGRDQIAHTLGADHPAGEDQPKRAFGRRGGLRSPRRPRWQPDQPDVGHDLKSPHRHAREGLADVGGDAHDAGGVLVGPAQPRVVPQAPTIQPAQRQVPRARLLVAEAGRRLQASPHRPDHVGQALRHQRAGVAHRDGRHLVADVEAFPPGTRVLQPPAGSQVEHEVGRLEQAVEPLQSPDAGRLDPFDDPRPGYLRPDRRRAPLAVGENRQVHPLGEQRRPVVRDECLTDVGAVDGRRHQQHGPPRPDASRCHPPPSMAPRHPAEAGPGPMLAVSGRPHGALRWSRAGGGEATPATVSQAIGRRRAAWGCS